MQSQSSINYHDKCRMILEWANTTYIKFDTGFVEDMLRKQWHTENMKKGIDNIIERYKID